MSPAQESSIAVRQIEITTSSTHIDQLKDKLRCEKEKISGDKKERRGKQGNDTAVVAIDSLPEQERTVTAIDSSLTSPQRRRETAVLVDETKEPESIKDLDPLVVPDVLPLSRSKSASSTILGLTDENFTKGGVTSHPPIAVTKPLTALDTNVDISTPSCTVIQDDIIEVSDIALPLRRIVKPQEPSIQEINDHTRISEEFGWTCKGDPEITHVKKIGQGGSGDVHMVLLTVVSESNQVDAKHSQR